MTNGKLLIETIERKGVKARKLCEALGCSYPTLRRKLDGKTEFMVSEIVKLRDFLSLSDAEVQEIFLH